MKVHTTEGMLAATSFLLGKFHTSVYLALQEKEPAHTFNKIIALEREMREEIEKLYYPTRDPS